MYLTLTDLQNISSCSFPSIVPSLRRALTTASTIIHCSRCPQQAFSAIQNVITLVSLLSAIAERFHKVIQEIEEEAERLEQTGEKKPFRVGDNDPAHAHLHTGSLDCPMGFNIHLDGHEWRKLTKKVLKTEVMGGGGNPTPLASLVDQMEQRQRRWHVEKADDAERQRIFGVQTCDPKGHDATCLRMVTHVRTMIDSINWE